MWPFSKDATLAAVKGYKKISVNGMRFTIRRLNPLKDFPADKMPQIFTDFQSRRPEVQVDSPAALKKAQEDMYAILKAGIVEPEIVAEEAKDGIKASDLFRDTTMGPKLFIEIVSHSLTVFRGLKGVFFSARTRLWLWMRWLKGMGVHRRMSLSQAKT
jgi:hypothetical protein